MHAVLVPFSVVVAYYLGQKIAHAVSFYVTYVSARMSSLRTGSLKMLSRVSTRRSISSSTHLAARRVAAAPLERMHQDGTRIRRLHHSGCYQITWRGRARTQLNSPADSTSARCFSGFSNRGRAGMRFEAVFFMCIPQGASTKRVTRDLPLFGIDLPFRNGL